MSDATTLVATLLATLESADEITFDCDGRDYALAWDSAGDNAIDATVWDETSDTVTDREVATLRFTVQVIA